jgi:hypothetical protein
MSGETEIRPFRVDMPDEAIADLRRRIAARRWPSRELVADQSQGVQLATLQELARYWATDYDWGACEAKLNALPQFTTEIDGLDIHFIHVKSEHSGALPSLDHWVVHTRQGSWLPRTRARMPRPVSPAGSPTRLCSKWPGTARESRGLAFQVVGVITW